MQDWYDFRSRCPALDCTNPTSDLYWVHSKCEEHEKINAYGMIQCLKDRRGYSCLNPTFILELSFKCNNNKHTNFKKVEGEGEKFLDAILIATKITSLPRKFCKNIVHIINHYDDED